MTRALLLVLVLVLASCGPRCLKGHYTPRWVEAWDSYDVIARIPVGKDGSFPIYAWHHHEGYWTQDFVCDQYEVERFEK